MSEGIHIRAHALVMWRRFRPWPIPWKYRAWPVLGQGIPYYRWKYYLVEIVGEGVTQAERDPIDVQYMALDYMACKHGKDSKDFHVESVEWIRHY